MKYLLLLISVVSTVIILSIGTAYAEEHIIVPNVVVPVVTVPAVVEPAVAEHHEATEEFEVLEPQFVFIETPVTEEPIEVIEWEEPSLWAKFVWWLNY